MLCFDDIWKPCRFNWKCQSDFNSPEQQFQKASKTSTCGNLSSICHCHCTSSIRLIVYILIYFVWIVSGYYSHSTLDATLWFLVCHFEFSVTALFGWNSRCLTIQIISSIHPNNECKQSKGGRCISMCLKNRWPNTSNSRIITIYEFLMFIYCHYRFRHAHFSHLTSTLM